MRRFAFVCGWLLALTAFGATPDVGKDALRKLVRLPSITFDSTWNFDPERGFNIGSSARDVSTEISRLRQQLRHDSSDAEVEFHLAELYSRLNDFAAAHRALARAVDCYRDRVDRQPGDASLLCGYGRALQGIGKFNEAESVLRKAVEMAPKNWRCRVALGRFLDSGARRIILVRPAEEKLSGATVNLAKRELIEAGECFEKAVALASDEGEAYFRRGMHRVLKANVLNEIRRTQDQSDMSQPDSQFSEAALSDLQKATHLRPNDYSLMGNTVLFEIYTMCARQDQMNWASFSWSVLPENAQHAIRNTETRLENLGQDSDTQVAAGALEVLGILQGPVLGETRNCIRNLRRAVALDASRDQAWDILCSALAQTHRYDELLAVCQARVRERESARAHLLLGKAFEKQGQWDAAEAEVMESLRLGPNDFTANLAEASLVLRRSSDPDALLDANSWLARSERLFGDLPPQDRNPKAVIELTLTRSIYFALTDQLDAARQWANAVLSQDKNNPVAQQILSAMDY